MKKLLLLLLFTTFAFCQDPCQSSKPIRFDRIRLDCKTVGTGINFPVMVQNLISGNLESIPNNHFATTLQLSLKNDKLFGTGRVVQNGAVTTYDNSSLVNSINGQTGIVNISIPTPVQTNLSYTASPTNGFIVNSNGTNATIPLANSTNSGLMSPTDFNKLQGNLIVADATPTVKGVLKLSGDLGGTADNPTTPTAVHLTGNETIFGEKTFVNNTSANSNYFKNNFDGSSVYFENISQGIAFSGVNQSGGIGFYLKNNSIGNAFFVNNEDLGNSFTSLNQQGIGFLSETKGEGSNFTANMSQFGTGFNYIGQNRNLNTFTVDRFGNIISKSIISNGVNLNTEIANKQATLVSGTNIKTVNSQSLLGTGNITTDYSGTFVDVSISSSNQQIGAGFTTIVFNNENSDVNNLFNPAINTYLVPVDGIYQITGTLRTLDGSVATKQWGVGVHTSNADGAWFLWHAVQATTSGSNRTTYPYIRVGRFLAGQQLRMFAYCDAVGGVAILNAGMQIIKIAQ